MNVKKFIAAPLIIILLILQGCSGLPVNVGISEDTDLSKYDMDNPRKTSISASGFQLLLFIPIRTNSRHQRAYAAIEREAAGGLISDVKIMESWTYAAVGTVYTTTIEATIYPRK